MPGPSSANFEIFLSFKDTATGKFTSATNAMIAEAKKMGVVISQNGKVIGEDMQKAGTHYSKAAKGMRLSTEGLRAEIGRLRNSLLLVVFAYQAVKNVIVPLINASIQQEFAERKLESAFIRTGLASREQVKHLKGLAFQLQKNTMYGDEAIINASAMLATYKLNAKQVEQMTPLLLDMATATKNVTGQETDLQTIALAVGKAVHGQVGSLTRYGIVLTDTEKKQHSFNQILAAMKRQVEGAAEAMGTTFLGQVAMLKNALGDFGEKLGDVIIRSTTVRAIIGMFKEDMIILTEKMQDASTDTDNFANAWDYVANTIIVVRAQLKLLWRSLTEGFKVAELAVVQTYKKFQEIRLLTIQAWNPDDIKIIQQVQVEIAAATIRIAEINKELEAGAKNVVNVYDELLDEKEKLMAKIIELKGIDLDYFNLLKKGLVEHVDNTREAWNAIEDMTKALAGNMESSFETLFFDAFTKQLKSVWDYMDAFTKDILKSLSKVLAQMVVMSLMPKAYTQTGYFNFWDLFKKSAPVSGFEYMGSGGMGIGHAGGYVGKNRIQRFQTGGIVPALLEQGEGVVNRYGMSRIGQMGLESLNKGKVPGGNAGTTIVYIQAMDVKSFREYLMKNKDIYVSTIYGNIESNDTLRKLFRSGI